MRITMPVVYIMLHVYYMTHLNKLNKSIKSKRLSCSGDVIYFQRRRVPTSQCKLRRSRANSRLYKWTEHDDLFTLQIIPSRAPSIWAEPGRAHLLSVGQAHMTFEWAEHGRKRLHYTKPGSAPCRARLNCIV